MSFDFDKETKKSKDDKLEESLAQTLKNKKATRPKKKTMPKLDDLKGRTKVTVTFSLRPATKDKLRKIANDNGYPAVSEARLPDFRFLYLMLHKDWCDNQIKYYQHY